MTEKTTKFKNVLNGLPHDTVAIRKALAEEGILERSTVFKWYNGSMSVTDVRKLRATAKFLNLRFPRENKKDKVTIEELAD